MTVSTDDQRRWRMVDIVVAAVVAVAFGARLRGVERAVGGGRRRSSRLPPAQAIIYGVWLVPGVLVGLIVRRPGAALFGGLVSAIVSALLGSTWGIDTVVSGAIQGGGAELGFAIGLYRVLESAVRVLAAALSAPGPPSTTSSSCLLPGDGRRLLDRLHGGPDDRAAC